MTSHALHATEQLLFDCLGAPDPRLLVPRVAGLTEARWAALLAMAEEHMVRPIVVYCGGGCRQGMKGTANE